LIPSNIKEFNPIPTVSKFNKTGLKAVIVLIVKMTHLKRA
jgi:hypothetical protein